MTSVPLFLCSTDGTMTLFSFLEEKVQEHGNPPKICSLVIDGNFLLHSLPLYLPSTYSYGGLLRVVLHTVLAHPSQIVDIVFDTYEEPSLKASERHRRGVEETIYVISGPDQVRPKDMVKALKSSSFKQQLPRFFMKD